ncbi:siderophore-interacting protein [Hamadaea sp. NPDC051192]|uniref:siderophore-interacting protein n=1 Tax=Hamadaea sp. NPDC051192 TaxID=3154940 RepID=UPI0034286A2F
MTFSASSPSTREPGGRRGHRPPPRPVEVVAVERLAPRIVSVLFGGASLAGFTPPLPTAHIKLFLPDADGEVAAPTVGPDGLSWPTGRPTMRTYTPRRFDAAALTLEVQFVLHGDGPAAQFARDAVPGDRAAIGGPGGRFSVDPAGRDWWIGGDDSALPAIATLIEALPTDARVRVEVEVAGPGDRIALPAHPGAQLHWHDRGTGDWGGELLDAVRGSHLDPQTDVWVACEAAAVRRIRRHLLDERGLPSAQVTTRGYWQAGQANHPDHDFGED